MKPLEKLFLGSAAVASIFLALVFLLFALQKQGILPVAVFGDKAWRAQQEETETKETKIKGVPVGEVPTKKPEREETSAGDTMVEESTENIENQEQSASAGIEEETAMPSVVLPVPEVETEPDPYPYYIKVNKKQNCVTIYQKDAAGEYTVPIKAMICSTGNATPLGVFGSKGKYVMKGLIHGVFGQYSTWITGNILFHSVPSARATKDSVSVRNYNQLGTTASAGCIRLTVADAKWIYDNCEIGTLIEIYEGEEVGPLGKPEAIKLPDGSKWDPTDPDPENPWHEHQPSIAVENEKLLYFGEEWTPYEDIEALDTCGNDITQKVEIVGEVDCYQPGSYPIHFTVTDAVGKTAEAACNYIVLPVPVQEKETSE